MIQPDEDDPARRDTEPARAPSHTEAALQASHDSFRNLVETSPFGVYAVDADFRVALVSTGAQNVFANVRPLMGRDFADVLRTIWPEPFASEAIERFRHTLATGERYHAPSTVEKRRDIEATESYDWKIERLILPDGRPGVVCRFYDLTERQRYEAALRERERQLRYALQSASAGAWEWDLTTGSLNWTNETLMLHRCHSMPSTFHCAAWLECVDSVDRASVQEALAAVMAGHESELRVEYRISNSPQTPRWLFCVGRLIPQESEARPRMTGIVIDVTERKTGEEAVARLAAIVSSSNDAIVGKTLDGVITSWNSGAEQMFGYTEDEMLGQSVLRLIPPEHRDEEDRIVTRLRAGLRIAQFESTRLTKSGRKIAVSLTISPIKDKAGRLIGAAKIARDITAAKQVEAALREQDERKNEFLATLAHELRNPLAPIHNAAQYLRQKGPAVPELQRARDIILRQVQQMARLVDDLLDVSRIGQGKIALRLAPTDLATVLHTAVETSRPQIEERSHVLVVELPDEPIHMDADLTRLAQVFGNLLNNAAKYTERGGRIVLRGERDADQVIVRVADSGIGIKPEDLRSIFEMFTQIDTSHVRAQGGLGIGLALAKRLVDLHGGSIEACSAGVGHGSEFVVRLPLEQRPTERRSDLASDAPDRCARTGLRVLVVDDNRDAADSLSLLLEAAGCVVRTANDGNQAIATAQSFQPDVVLLDLGLPQVSGYEVCRMLRGEPWATRTIVVAVTGWGQDGHRARTHEAGFDHHLVKPIDPEGIVGLIVRLHQQRRDAGDAGVDHR